MGLKFLTAFKQRKADIVFALTILSFFAAFVMVYFYREEIAIRIIQKNFGSLDGLFSIFGDFLTLTKGVIIEAFPFVVLGVAVSVMIQRFVTQQRLVSILPKNRFSRRGIISVLGLLMPVCECGNVPVARSLIARGFSVQESIVFLLAAPSINFITILVTLEAFNFDKRVALVRVIATLIIANLAAYLVIRLIKSKRYLTEEFQAVCKVSHRPNKSIKSMLDTFYTELWLITKLLIVGALIAAASQTLIPADVITAIGSNIFLSVIAMLLLAFIISICSSVDSFFALAYVGTFNLGAIAAFLIAGPMVDIKMISLMRTTYTTRVIAVISATVLLSSLIIGVVLSYVW